MKITSSLRLLAATALLALASVLPVRAQSELIVNGGFESGSASWILAGGVVVDTTAGFARTGAGYLWLGGAVNENDSAYQTIAIPSSATTASLSFYYNILSDEDISAPANDTFTATIRNNSGGLLATVGNWSNVNQDSVPTDYHQQTFDLLPYAGQTIRVQFNSHNDAALATSFDVDDVSVQVTAGPPPNDVCNGAIPMTAGTTYTMNTGGATSTGDPVPSCQSSFGKTVWYSFTPPANGNVTISTCGSDFNTVLAIFTGSCGSLLPVACNDDNGPSCATSQASVTFLGASATTYFIMVAGVGGASGNLSILATGGTGLQIIPTFDTTITSDPQAATIEATINAAIAAYQANFSDSITVNITFKEMGTGLGLSSSYYQDFLYSDYRSALVSHATTVDDATAIAHLPISGSNPVNGNPNMKLHLPLARALGLPNSDPPPGQPDGTISLNTGSMNLSPGVTDPSKYSLFATASHEIDEVLGMGSALNGLSNGSPPPTSEIAPEDLFRYDGSGARSFLTDLSAAAYFSLDGTTDLARFNQNQGGDFGDWYSPGGQTPEIQDAYGTRGANPVLGVELRVLDAIGYTRVVSARPTLSLTHLGNNVIISWPATFPGFTLQSATSLVSSASWITNSSPPVLLNSQYTVTNSASGRLFYRLIK